MKMLYQRCQRTLIVVLLCLALLTGVFAQFDNRQGGRAGRGFGGRGGPGMRMPDRSEYPMWQVEPAFKHDAFTFVRIRYDSYRNQAFGGWANDYPDCDWNFSIRLRELTSLNVDPNGRVLRLTDPELADFPFAYMSNPGEIILSDDELLALRKYLRNGGFLMVDDFWAIQEWSHLRAVMHQVLPAVQPRELTTDHELFHMVYDLRVKPQVPSIRAWSVGDTFEHWHGPTGGDEEPHFWGYFDEANRLMALFCHNNDIGDGWEREGDNKEYFEKYSVPVSYPLGINIISYSLTH